MTLELIIGGAVAVFGAIFYAFRSGKTREQNKQREQAFKAIDKAKEVENEIDKMDDATVRDRAAKWVRSKR